MNLQPPASWAVICYARVIVMKKIFIFSLLLMQIAQFAYSDEYTDLTAQRDALKQQIEAVDSEIARCKKTTKDWTAATIIGGVGTVASGIGIIAQQSQIKENEKVLKHNIEEAKKADSNIEFIKKVTE